MSNRYGSFLFYSKSGAKLTFPASFKPQEIVDRLIAKARPEGCLTSDRYAQGGEKNDISLYIQRPEGLYRIGGALVNLTRYIGVYGPNEERVVVHYVAHVDPRADSPVAGEQIPQYGHAAIVKAGLCPIPERDLPIYYRVVNTEVCYHSVKEA